VTDASYSVTIDANIVKALHHEALGLEHDCSGMAEPVFRHLQKHGWRIALDDGDHIKHEWSACVDPEWFTDWFFSITSTYNVAIIKPDKCADLVKKLYIDCGFPRSRDVWLVRVAVSESSNHSSLLLSEDMDFREPSQKLAPSRVRSRYIRGEMRGSVSKVLRKNGVEVRSLCQC
jgi:hypothetical protein